MRQLNYVVFVSALISVRVDASNILIWNPTIGRSHVTFLGNIADVLTADGHNVTIFSPGLDPHVEIFGNKLPARTIRFHGPSVNADDWLKLGMKQSSMWESPPCDSVCFEWSDYDSILEQERSICKDLLDDQHMMASLNESHFDLAYAEAIDGCAPGIFEILGIRSMVTVSAFGMAPRLYDIAGILPFPSFMPALLTPYSDDMTFIERLLNFKIEVESIQHMRKWDRKFGDVFRARFPGFPGIGEIYNEKTALIMINVNEFTESPRPTTNMIRYIGGATLHDPEVLEEKLNEILNERNTTVLFSMGSLAQSKDMPARLKNDIIDAFSSFPNISFLWKYEGDDHVLFDSHPNIYPMKWIPQTDLLADERLSLFITHGGMNSMLEAMSHGKPMIVIPLFGDQQLNARNIQRHGVGKLIERHRLNKYTLKQAIQETLGNRAIARESAFVASLLSGRPKQYREDIAKWARIIIAHGKMNHLRLRSKSMNFLQYYSLDVIGFLGCLTFIVAFMSLWIVRWIFVHFAIVKRKTD